MLSEQDYKQPITNEFNYLKDSVYISILLSCITEGYISH